MIARILVAFFAVMLRLIAYLASRGTFSLKFYLKIVLIIIIELIVEYYLL